MERVDDAIDAGEPSEEDVGRPITNVVPMEVEIVRRLHHVEYEACRRD